jgi:hypothetical protein
MTKDANVPWLTALQSAVVQKADQIRPMFDGTKKLRLRVSIKGPAPSMNLLDVHDATAKIADQITDVLFPRRQKSPVPQQDRHFWACLGTKTIAARPRVDIWLSTI